MTNYGIKISQDGYDVKTATDTQLVFSSKFDSVASASIVMTGTSSQTSSSTITFTISHNLGYTPFVLVFYKNTSDNWQLFWGFNTLLLAHNTQPSTLNIYNDDLVVTFIPVGGSQSVTIKYIIFKTAL